MLPLIAAAGLLTSAAITLAAALTATVAFAAPASADTASFRCPAKDTVIETTDGDTIRHMGMVGPVEDAVCEQKINRRSQMTLFGGLWNADGNYISTARSEISALFPLKAGNRASTTMTSPTSGMTYHVIFEVHQGKLTTPAGAFDTFLIDHTETSMTGLTEVKFESWYAPAVNAIIKQRFTQVRGNLTGPSDRITSWEAESVTLPPSP